MLGWVWAVSLRFERVGNSLGMDMCLLWAGRCHAVAAMGG